MGAAWKAAKAVGRGARAVGRVEGGKKQLHNVSFGTTQVRCMRCQGHPGRTGHGKHAPKCGNCRDGWITKG